MRLSTYNKMFVPSVRIYKSDTSYSKTELSADFLERICSCSSPSVQGQQGQEQLEMHPA